MSIVLYHHPHSRAASVVWMLEELGVDYELRFVDFAAGEHKTESILALNPMGKLPILTDGDQVVTETAAIGLYLADRYASGRLAPAVDDPKRAAYLRWSLFSPSVIEPCAMAKMGGWEYKDGQAGWGAYDAMLKSIEHALGGRDYLLGEFSMADMIFGGTVRFMLMFNMIDPSPATTAYAKRLAERPALVRAEERNAAIASERGLAG
ncbi:MAG: glutathione S-transferase family protein [Haliangiales bacterium]